MLRNYTSMDPAERPVSDAKVLVCFTCQVAAGSNIRTHYEHDLLRADFS